MNAVPKSATILPRAAYSLPDLLTPNERISDLPLAGNWPELLWDLIWLGRVCIETATPTIQLAQTALLQGIRVHQDIGLATGRRFALHLFLEQWHTLQAVSLTSSASLTVKGLRC